MTKTELQLALAEATQTNKKTAEYSSIRLVLWLTKRPKRPANLFFPALVSWVKQKRRARTGFNPKTQQKIRIPAKTVLKFRVAKVAKDTVLAVKK
jgi:DNA-binding protein HU-beta